MARMFDALRPETPMIRWNFSLYGDDRLFHPDVSGHDQPRFGSGPRAGPVYLRWSGRRCGSSPGAAPRLSIRISVDPLERLEATRRGRTSPRGWPTRSAPHPRPARL